MEKFGIFELLDALSAATAPKEADFQTEAQKPHATGAPFSAPSYGGQTDGAEPPRPVENTDALAGFLARHETLSKRIDKEKH